MSPYLIEIRKVKYYNAGSCIVYKEINFSHEYVIPIPCKID